VYDPHPFKHQESMELVDVLARARPETQVVQTDAALIEAHRSILLRRLRDHDRRFAAHHVQPTRETHRGPHAKVPEYFLVEIQRPRQVVDGELHVRHSRDFDHRPLLSQSSATFAPSSASGARSPSPGLRSLPSRTTRTVTPSPSLSVHAVRRDYLTRASDGGRLVKALRSSPGPPAIP
jgi:hypothetical protein